MKFNVLRALMIPWILYFFVTIASYVFAALNFPSLAHDPKYRLLFMEVGGFLCLVLNYSTLSRAGIWVADSLPFSFRRNPKTWMIAAGVAIVVAAAFYLIGQAPWMPLYWQGFVIPTIFTLSLFVILRSLLGLTLKKAARVQFIRTFTLLMILPMMALISLTALFLGQNIVVSYEASRPNVLPRSMMLQATKEQPAAVVTVEDPQVPPVSTTKRAQEFQAAIESGQSCVEQNKEIRLGLDPNASEDVAYWAVKAVKCTDMKGVVILPRLVDLMIKHKSPKVRAAAVNMMAKYSNESVKQVSYLLVKHLHEREPKEVLEASATILSRLGDGERGLATNRLKAILDSQSNSIAAAEILIHQMKRSDLVANYVSDHLTESTEARSRAISMICLLPESDRKVATSHVSEIAASIKQGHAKDPAMLALACLGGAGLQAVRQEVQNPQKMPRPLAAQALAEMDLKNDSETLKTVTHCLQDENEEVRKWCSHSMGKIGKLALPQILDLLKSKDPELTEAGHLALQALSDPEASEELRRVRAENSGWTANRKKLEMANEVSSALVRIESLKQ